MKRTNATSMVLIPCLLGWSTPALAEGPAVQRPSTEATEVPVDATGSEQPTGDASTGSEQPTGDASTGDASTGSEQPTEDASTEDASTSPATDTTDAPAPAVDDGGLPSADLPSYDAVPIGEPIGTGYDTGNLPPPIPKDGRGLLTLGGIMLGGGAVLTAIAIPLIVSDTDVLAWAGASVFGGLSMVAGSIFVAAGHKRFKDYRSWEAEQADAIPRQGNGLRAGGTASLIGGSLGLTLGGVSLAIQDPDELPYGEVLLGLGAGAVAGGVVMTVIGVRRERAFHRWRLARDTAPAVQLVPSLAPLRGGASVGLVGRF